MLRMPHAATPIAGCDGLPPEERQIPTEQTPRGADVPQERRHADNPTSDDLPYDWDDAPLGRRWSASIGTRLGICPEAEEMDHDRETGGPNAYGRR